MSELVDFRGTNILKHESEVLLEIENLLNRKFTLKASLDINEVIESLDDLLFTVENNRVTGLSIHDWHNCTECCDDKGDWCCDNPCINCKGIQSFPKIVFELKYLKDIIFTNYDFKKTFTTIPPDINKLNSLERICIINNRLKNLPINLFNLPSLKLLYIHSENLIKIPYSIGNAKSLETVIIKNALVKNLPDSIGDLLSLKHLELHGVTRYNAFGPNNQCEIKYLPNSMKQLSLLETLILYNIPLIFLPSFIRNLPNLKKYYSNKDYPLLEESEIQSHIKTLLSTKDESDLFLLVESYYYPYLSDVDIETFYSKMNLNLFNHLSNYEPELSYVYKEIIKNSSDIILLEHIASKFDNVMGYDKTEIIPLRRKIWELNPENNNNMFYLTKLYFNSNDLANTIKFCLLYLRQYSLCEEKSYFMRSEVIRILVEICLQLGLLNYSFRLIKTFLGFKDSNSTRGMLKRLYKSNNKRTIGYLKAKIRKNINENHYQTVMEFLYEDFLPLFETTDLKLLYEKSYRDNTFKRYRKRIQELYNNSINS